MKRKLKFTAEFIKEFDKNDDPDRADYNFDEWANVDYDCVDRPIENLIDQGWKITRKSVSKID